MTNWVSLSCLLSLSPWRLFDHFFVNINFWKSHQDKVELFKDEFVRSCWSELIHHVTKAEAQITFKGMWWCRLKLTLTNVVIHVQQEESFYISLDFDWLLSPDDVTSAGRLISAVLQNLIMKPFVSVHLQLQDAGTRLINTATWNTWTDPLIRLNDLISDLTISI